MANKETFKIVSIDNNKMRDNILYFAKLKGIKIGEVEKAIDRRLGYISRWRKNSSKAVPIEDVYNIARFLGVTVEDIIMSDINVLKKNLEIEKLNKQITKIRIEKGLEIERIKQQIIELEDSDE